MFCPQCRDIALRCKLGINALRKRAKGMSLHLGGFATPSVVRGKELSVVSCQLSDVRGAAEGDFGAGVVGVDCDGAVDGVGTAAYRFETETFLSR